MPPKDTSIIPTSGSKMAKYKTSLCKHFEQTGTCQMENRCHFAHGKHELRKQTDVSSHHYSILWSFLFTNKFHEFEVSIFVSRDDLNSVNFL